MLITNATLANGETATIRLDGDRITEVELAAPAGRRQLAASDGEEVLDATGLLVLPAPAEPHGHLDKALTADRVPNPAGDLMGAVTAWLAHRLTLDRGDFADRATRAALQAVANGCTAIRTHVDLGSDVGTMAVEALLQVKAALAAEVDLQVVGLVGRPMTGPDGGPNRAVLQRALELGLDVVGGCPHLDPHPSACTEVLLAVARRHGRPVDLHTDENLSPTSLDLELLARRVLQTGFDHGVVASHCVSLGIQPVDVQERVADTVAAAGVAVVTLPQTNLFLQARGHRSSPPRGLTAIAALEDAGVVVAGGGDNLQDPFCTVGRGDPLETAALLVMAAHLPPELAYDYVSNRARLAMGLEPVVVSAGSPAELLLVRAANVREAVATAPAERTVVHRGRVVARTSVTRERPLAGR